MRNKAFVHRHAGLVCSLALHTRLLAWIVWPHQETFPLPQQQVVNVSVVMLSTLASAQAEAMPTTALEKTPAPAPDTLSMPMKSVSKPEKAAKESKPEHQRQAASASPTTGRQAPDATQKVDAITKPVISLHNSPPAYPDEARRRGIEGIVTLEVDVNSQGTAQDVTVTHSSGYALLDRAANDAIRHWRFIPAQCGDEIVEARVLVPVEFKLE